MSTGFSANGADTVGLAASASSLILLLYGSYSNRNAGRDPAPLKDVFKRSRDKRERSHISLFGKDFPDLPIKRVIVGPSRSQENNVLFARKIVGRSLPVSKSATPYIG